MAAELSPSKKFERVAIIGAGIGGIAAAAALAPHSEEVFIFDKDEIPTSSTPRKGVPQSAQLHNLLSRAQIHLEELLPGFSQSLFQTGAGNANVSKETHVFELGMQMPERDLGLRLLSAPRPIIEHCARSIIATESNICLQGLTQVTDIRFKNDHIEGIKISHNSQESEIEAQVVVDASGSGSKALRWLQAAGYGAIETQKRQFNQWYVSTQVQRPKEFYEVPDFWMTFPTYPQTRGGLISPIGPESWYVSLSGRSKDTPPKNFREVQDYAETLEDSTIADLLKKCHLVRKPHFFGKPDAWWRRYDRGGVNLPGFLPIGDSIASHNPLFGQGISVAAWQAAELSSIISTSNNLSGITDRYIKTAAAASAAAWQLGELVQPESSSILTSDEWQNLTSRIKLDPVAHKEYVEVWHLLKPASQLIKLATS